MPKTSTSFRREEFISLNCKSINGRLCNWKDISRWRKLRKEFEKVGSERVVVSKTVESD